MDLEAAFTQAQEDSKALPERPGNLTLLRIYALFKQASLGDAGGERPGLGDFVGRAKWDAWRALAGMDMDEAKREYVALIESLK